MGLCGSNDINVKDGLNTNLTFDMNGNKLDNTFFPNLRFINLLQLKHIITIKYLKSKLRLL